VDAATLSILLENGPGVAVAGAMYFVWRREAKAREKAEAAAADAEKRLVTDLKGQIALWRQLKELADAR